MIDAATFAQSYIAFWRSATPTCDLYIRRLNLDGWVRFEPPVTQSSSAARRGVIAEYAFSLFAVLQKLESASSGEGYRDRGEVARDLAWRDTVKRLGRYSSQGLDLETPLSREENEEVGAIFRCLRRFFSTTQRPVITRPLFLGCGFIDTSEGDVLFGNSIYEVKAVDRGFRSADIRQLVTYAALNSASGQYDLRHLGLFNPRRGVYWEAPIPDVIQQISGRNAIELFSQIVETVSSGGLSR